MELSPEVVALLNPALMLIVKALVMLVFGFAGGREVVQAVTGALKKIPQLKAVSAPTLAFGVSVLVAFGIVVSTHLGVEVEFSSILDLITTVLAGVFGVHIMLVGSQKNYEQDKATIALFGATRPDEDEVVDHG